MSWELLGPDRMIKIMELSDFTNTEMLIPKELTSFWGNEGERLAIIYQNREYPSYLESEGGNAKLKWSKVLIRKLGEAFPEYESWFSEERDQEKTPSLEIIKTDDVFMLSLINCKNESQTTPGPHLTMTAEQTDKTQSGLSELLKKWIVGYPNYYPRDFRFSFKDIINDEIPKVIESFAGIKAGNYKVLGFAGDTQWAEIPWVKVIDKQTQTINKDGLYLAYILAMDSRKLYLAIVYGNEEVGVRSLSEKAAEYRGLIQNENYQTNHKEVLLANATLVSGIVCYREYTEEAMPEDSVLAAEFEDFRRMYHICLMANSGQDEMSEEQALKTVNEEASSEDTLEEPSEIIPLPEEPTVAIEMTDFSEQNNEMQSNEDEANTQMTVEMAGESEALPAAESHHEEPEKVQTDDAINIPAIEGVEAGAPETMLEDKQPLKTVNSSQCDEENLSDGGCNPTIEKDQKKLIQNFRHYPVKNDYLPPNLQLVQAKMGSKGYYYPAELIKSYYLSIKSKPFVMITGRVGSGKSSFPHLFAEVIGANTENGRFKRLLIGKDWNDDSHLWGQLDNRGHFIPGPVTLLLKAAKEYPEKPHFLLLDEMDQSPPLDYFRLLLEGINGNKEPLLTREDFGADITAFREYGNLSFPDNLYIIGTINEGPGSFPIPVRIIDCGNLIKMPVVEIGVFADYGNPAGDSEWENSAFKIQTHANGLPEILEKLMHSLNQVQKILVDFDRSMGYRGKNEILAFGINSGIEGLFTEKEVIDLAILQRILPALLCEKKVETAVYQSLACFLLEDNLAEYSLKNQPLNRFCGEYEKLLSASAIPCPRSGARILKYLKSLSR